MTRGSATALAGTGLIGVAKDNLERTGTVPALAAGFVQIELDLETGKFEILDYLGVADCGTVLHPQSLANQDRIVNHWADCQFARVLGVEHSRDQILPHPELRGRTRFNGDTGVTIYRADVVSGLARRRRLAG